MVRRMRGLSLFGAGVVAIGMAWAWPRESTVLDQATRLHAAGEFEDYAWLTPRSIVVGDEVDVRRSDGGRVRAWQPFEFDVQTGKREPLTAVDERVIAAAGPKERRPISVEEWELSPDRKWIFWAPITGPDVQFSRIDGSASFSWRPAEGMHPVGVHWLPDSTGFAVFYSADKAHVTSVERYDLTAKRTWSSSDLTPLSLPAGAQGFSDRGALLLDPTSSHPSLAVLDLAGRSKPVTTPPPHDKLSQILPSPDGSRIAWTFVVNVPIRRGPMSKLAGFFRPNRQNWGCSLWISRGDGSGLHEVGRMTAEGGERADHGLFYSARWMPDGKRLSFLCRDSIWSLPVE